MKRKHPRIGATAAILVGVAGALVVACGTKAPTGETVDFVTDTSFGLVCPSSPAPDAGEPVGPAVYVPAAMNNKLLRYPDFAAAVAMKQGDVTDCTSAERFYSGYVNYATAHPDFDSDEPHEQSIEGAPTSPPPGPPPTWNVPKIYNGTAGGTSPIVNIRFLNDPVTTANYNAQRLPGAPAVVPNTKYGCTATFINKEWAITAGHCILGVAAWPKSPNPDGTIPVMVPKLVDWYPTVEVDWPNPDGSGSTGPAFTLNGNQVFTIPDPDYIGFNPTMWTHPVSRHDFALIQFYRPDVAGFYPADPAQALAVSTAEPDISWQLTAWGYGVSTPFATTAQPFTLQSTLIQPNSWTIELGPAPAFAEFSYLSVSAPNQPNYGITCTGDSGGPWTRKVTNGAGQDQLAIVGETSNSTPWAYLAQLPPSDPNGPPIPTEECGVTPGIGGGMSDETDVPRTDVEMNWINLTLRSRAGYGSGFQCEQFAGWAQCWGPKSCGSDCDCPPGYGCFRPIGSPNYAMNGCPACGGVTDATGALDCSCIKGMCISTPQTSDIPSTGTNCNNTGFGGP